MRYRQEVFIRDVSLKKANETFKDIKFLKYLIALQPVKVIRWDGTYDGAVAHMKFWFFGWKDFIVSHGNNKHDKTSFSFKDIGTSLPFGLTLWEHVHKVVEIGDHKAHLEGVSKQRKQELRRQRLSRGGR